MYPVKITVTAHNADDLAKIVAAVGGGAPALSERDVDQASKIVGRIVEPASAPTPDARVDANGVPFNPEFCADAADPYYGTGPRTGQWKKRRGVDEAAYEAWYSSQHSAPESDEDTTPLPNAAAAFGAPAAAVPRTAGEFFAWMSERQAAGVLSQDNIDWAWKTAGLAVAQIFPPTTPEVVERNVATLHGLISTRLGA